MNTPRKLDRSARSVANPPADRAALDEPGDRKFTDAAPLPPVEVDPLVLNHQRQSLLAKMFGTKSEPIRLDRYELDEELGRGGMGVVYKAHDPKLNRHVAIKLITKDDPRMRDRFQREAQAIAKVKHPNVIDIYDTDADENGRPYITMEYVDGQTLKAWLLESARDIYDIFKVFAAAGRGLAVVHDHGIVHHDFKPENVMIGKDGRVLVADFGLARASLNRDGDEDSETSHDSKDAFKVSITQTGALLGTLHYMAPELLDKCRGDVRTDQFAFCVSLYEALSGERFFQLQGKTKRDVYEEILRCQAKPLPRAKKVPRRVEAAMRKGLSVRPADRHASMAELTDLLERVSKRPERRRWFTWAAIVLVAVLALVGAFVVARAIIDHSPSIADFDRTPEQSVGASEPDPPWPAVSVVEDVPSQAPTQPATQPQTRAPPPAQPQPQQPQPGQPTPASNDPTPSEPSAAPRASVKHKRRKPETVAVKLHAGDFDTAVFDFGRKGERTVSVPKAIELPATKIEVKCREYDANKPREWVVQTLDLGADKRTIKCLRGVGPTLQ